MHVYLDKREIGRWTLLLLVLATIAGAPGVGNAVDCSSKFPSGAVRPHSGGHPRAAGDGERLLARLSGEEASGREALRHRCRSRTEPGSAHHSHSRNR
jgi:hypothetical protein